MSSDPTGADGSCFWVLGPNSPQPRRRGEADGRFSSRALPTSWRGNPLGAPGWICAAVRSRSARSGKEARGGGECSASFQPSYRGRCRRSSGSWCSCSGIARPRVPVLRLLSRADKRRAWLSLLRRLEVPPEALLASSIDQPRLASPLQCDVGHRRLVLPGDESGGTSARASSGERGPPPNLVAALDERESLRGRRPTSASAGRCGIRPGQAVDVSRRVRRLVLPHREAAASDPTMAAAARWCSCSAPSPPRRQVHVPNESATDAIGNVDKIALLLPPQSPAETRRRLYR